MKLSELKEQIKELYLQEETAKEIDQVTDAYKNLAKAKEEAGVSENKITVAEFKEYLRNEILSEINEEEEETPDEEVEVEPTIPEPPLNKRDALDDIGDQLVLLAKKAKETGEEELANQILNSAKFTEKKEFKAVSQDVGVQDRGES
jgi:hypothetical protein